MAMVAKILVGAVGLLFAFMAFGLLFNTTQAAADLGLTALTVQGQANVRADIAGFFVFCGGLSLYAAIRNNINCLWPVALLVGIALTGRGLSLIMDGPGEGAFAPIIAEIIIIVILLFARHIWTKDALKTGVN